MRLETAMKVRELAREIDTLVTKAIAADEDHILQIEANLNALGTPPGEREYNYRLVYTKEAAALRRRSMDLTRALADLRQGR